MSKNKLQNQIEKVLNDASGMRNISEIAAAITKVVEVEIQKRDLSIQYFEELVEVYQDSEKDQLEALRTLLKARVIRETKGKTLEYKALKKEG